MRAYIYILSLLVLVSSCRSIDKMVEGGRYDDAYAFAINKLRGKKQKKIKYVKGIEKAYGMLNSEDLSRIASLSARSSDAKWSQIFDAYDRIEVRQRLIMPLLPLVSKDGYRARINIVDYALLREEARSNAVAFHLDLADDLLDQAEMGDKGAARLAFEEYEKATSMDFSNHDINEKMKLAHNIGTMHIGIDMQRNNQAFYTDAFRNNIRSINTSRLNSFWTKYYVLTDRNDDEFDQYIVLDYGQLDFGRERESINNYEREKKVEDGVENVLDRKGNVKRDSLGNAITRTKYKRVKAFVSEVSREKYSSLSGGMMIFDDPGAHPTSTTPINVLFEFDDQAFRFRGDKRALPNHLRNKRSSRVLDFPSDYDCSYILAERFTEEVVRMIKRLEFLPTVVGRNEVVGI